MQHRIAKNTRVIRWSGWISMGALVGGTLAFVTLKGGAFEWQPIVILGAVGAVIGAVGAVVVRVGAPADRSPTNDLATVGCLVGVGFGGPLGAITGLGQPMLALFNPGLPPRDFQLVFGIVGGVFVGAVAGALAGAALSHARGRTQKARNEETSQ